MKNNSLVVHDTVYEMNRAYRAGAQAFRNGVPNSCNPHGVYTQAHECWDAGHVNESAGEHFRFELDLLSAPRNGTCFNMDPAVPRENGADVDADWELVQRVKLQALIRPCALAA